MNELYQRIYDIVRQIPPGRVTSYGAIAACLGSSGGLLESEGLTIVDDQIVHFADHFWTPAKELENPFTFRIDIDPKKEQI